jgi:hypothetical protein
MRQAYFCPNCRGTIVYPDRFCGTCGTRLIWETQQSESVTSPAGRSSSTSGAKTIHDDISKLLAECFDKLAREAKGQTHAPAKS